MSDDADPAQNSQLPELVSLPSTGESPSIVPVVDKKQKPTSQPRTRLVRLSWQKSARDRRNKLSRQFEDSLESIAEPLARHDSSDQVMSKHVDEAFTVLKRIGLCRLKFWERPEFLSTVGGVLVAFASGLKEIVEVLEIPPSRFPPHYQNIIRASCGIVGVLFMVVSYFRGSGK